MNLIQESFQRLFPEKQLNYKTVMEYNRRLSDFNANIKLQYSTIYVNLNLQWKDIDDEIKIGLIQHLLLKIFKQKKNTSEIKLYNHFIKNIPILTPKTKNDPLLAESFERINELFFYGQMEKPNLTWGQQAFRKLASYNFHNDTVTVSTVFKDSNQKVLDYLMYHELLHKHHKFQNKNGRSRFHTKAFREAEKLFPEYEILEKEINQIIKSKRKRKLWGLF